MLFYSVSIDGVYMLDTYHMVLARIDCVQPPTIKRHEIEIPGRHGKLDMSDFLGGPYFENRYIKMELGCQKRKDSWPALYSEILSRFHGRVCQIIFDDDPAHYWVGRVSIDSYERMLTIGILTITVDAYPYKYDLLSSSDDWLWDPFDFEGGYINETKNLTVSGSLSVTLIGGAAGSPIEVVSSASMTLQYAGKTYSIPKGTTKLYDIIIGAGEHTLKFSGNGTITINYRGESL